MKRRQLRQTLYRLWRHGLCAAVLVATPMIALAQTPYFVRDFIAGADPHRDGFHSGDLVACGDYLYFCGESKATGKELWRTDGTEAGTQLVVEAAPGENQGVNPRYYACDGSTLYFAGSRLWKSDGTALGTVMVKDLSPGLTAYSPQGLTAASNGKVYFQGDDGILGTEPWVSDGTPEGTVMLRDILGGAKGSRGGGDGFFEFNGWLYFAANDSEYEENRELWRTNLTTGVTELFVDLNGSGSGSPFDFTAVGSKFFFAANDGTNGFELWMSDGTEPNTEIVEDIYPGELGSHPSWLENMGGVLYFSANDGTHEPELWKSDGTPGGTEMVKDINTSGWSGVQSLKAVGSLLYFAADDGSNGLELWKSNGTEAGTVMVKDINSSGDSYPYDFESLGSDVFFSADNGSNGTELWKSDGTATGTVMVKDIYSGSESGSPWYLTAWNGVVYFGADEYTPGRELWRSDGTEGGTYRVKDAHVGAKDGLPRYLVESGGTLFLSATSSSKGNELWKTDGTPSGTVQVKDIRWGSSSSNPSGFFDFNGTLFFSATGSLSEGTELWKSNGSEAGTVLVKDINPAGSSGPSWKSALPDALVFTANDGTHGAELWKSDGTETGTVLVKDIVTGSTGALASLPFSASVGDVVVFRANDGVNGAELWVTDGTEEGTNLLKDIYPGSTGSSPTDFFSMGGSMFFQATDPTNGDELWKTDGTAEGTILVKDINAGVGDARIGVVTNWNGIYYFQADDGVHGRELWRSDGTEAGTYMVKDFWSGADDSHPSLIGMANGKMVLSAQDDVHGRELWVTDGTEAGTTFLYDILPGTNWWYSYRLGSHDGFAYFAAFSPETGLEVWSTNGTAAGTGLVADVRPGPESSYAHSKKYSNVYGDRLLFSAVDGNVGVELWGMCIGAFYEDLDGDGHGDPGTLVFDCSQPSDHVKLSDDCDDDDVTIYGGATELCDLKDNDCDLQADEPAFAGLTSAVSLGGSQCGVRLDWAATTACDGVPVYNVYRSGTSGFTPDGGSLIASCVAGPWFVDTSVVADSTYHYVVRAENPSTGGSGPCYGGGEETNVAELSATPTGCVGVAAGMPYFTSRAGNLSVRLEWLNPATGYGMSRVCWKSTGDPTGPSDGDCVDVVGAAGSYGTVVHGTGSPGGIVNNTLYYYGLWNNSMSNGSGVWSSGQFTTGRPFNTPSAQEWAYTTGAAALAPPGVRPGEAYYVSSNDQVLHSSQAGSSGGMWPTGWIPASMNGPSQGRPIVIPFGAPTISGADTVAFVGSQDGRVYAFDAETGVELWASDVLGDGVQASPSGVFSAFGEPYDLILAGTRTPAGDSKFYGLNLIDGTTAWTFDNGGGGARIGIISSQAWVDASNSRVYFTSWEGGSSDTVWCLQFDADSATKLWSAAIGNIESAPILRGGVLYVGTNAGEVHAFDATLGTVLWTTGGPYATGDGAVKGSVWVDDQPGGRRLYFSTTTKVHAVTDNGGSATELWSAITVAGASPVFVIDDDLYVGSSVDNGSLLRIDKATGSQSGAVQIGDPAAAKAIGPASYDWVNDAVIVGTGTGAVYSVTAGFGGE
jgi:ELWxxDGT repeat protein